MDKLEDEELLASKYRFKNCIHIYQNTCSDSDDSYSGQGDYHIFTECRLRKMQYLDVYTVLYAKFACPRYCPQYQPSL